MIVLLAIVVGVLYGAGIYMVLRRSLVKLILGLALLGHGANLLIFVSAGIRRAKPPLIPAGESAVPPGIADPVPQALILTAIVIGFGVLAFALVLFHRAQREFGTDNPDLLVEEAA